MKIKLLPILLTILFTLTSCTQEASYPSAEDITEELTALQKEMAFMFEKHRYEEYQKLYFSVLNLTDGPGSADFDTRPASIRAMFVVMILDMEIQNGGIAQFFYNCGPNYASLVPEALRETGLEDVAVLYEDFLAAHHITMAEIDHYPAAYPDFVSVYEAHPFEEFDDAYMKIWTDTNINVRLLTYAAAHPELYTAN